MDLEFIAGNFIYGDLPVGKEYLAHYFKVGAERAFISYYYAFPGLYKKGEDFKSFYENFCDHTGISTSIRWVRKLIVKLEKIQAALESAEKSFDLSRVGDIKSGKASF